MTPTQMTSAASGSIRIMPPDLTLKIAAGEVVERPSSAVKELLDNAIDAGARRITVEIRDAGLRLIRVTDNGSGMLKADVPLAFTSHATSKIGSLEDLESLATLGFRGEALPSIAAVARVHTQTKSRDEDIGTRFHIEYGKVLEEGACGASPGTQISVADLFGNVPARRKFVRSLRAETGQIQRLVMQYALARPTVHFMLSIDGRRSFESAGTGDLKEAFSAVYGTDALEHMHRVDWDEDGIEVRGLTSSPELNRSNRMAIDVFVNGRPVQNRSLIFALEEAYNGFLMSGRHPTAAIHLVVSSREVDANVHPAKSEVRFARDRAVHGVLHRAIANTLLAVRLPSRSLSSVSELDEEQRSAERGPEAVQWEPDGGSPKLMPEVPPLRVFGQTHQAFIIAEGPNGLYMIDQHAAHERILFDRLDEQLSSGTVPTQALLEPESLELNATEMQALETNRDLLEQVGFELKPFGHSTCLIRSVPALARGSGPSALVREVLIELQSAGEPSAARERALASMACQSAVKAGQSLDVHEMREIVVQLEKTLRPATCPHGRPTMIHVSHSRLEREFGRR